MNNLRLFGTYLLMMAVGAGLAVAVNYSLEYMPDMPSVWEREADSQLPPEFDKLAETWELLEQEHINRRNLDPAKLSEGAMRGMLEALDDPYASFLDREQFQQQESRIQGVFEGIGAQVGMQDNLLTVIAPLPGTPAEQAGIMAGDVILEVNGESTENMSLEEAVLKIRGEKGTTVQLLVRHIDQASPILIPIVRGVIPLETVRFTMLPEDIGYLHISNFSSNTSDDVREALREFNAAGGQGLIVDLRSNPGGLLSVVVDVTSQFLEDGLVTFELDGQGDRREWNVTAGGEGKGIPMVVLVNQFSASASEVFAGAILDHRRAPVVGETTFGKGSVNTRYRLADGSGVFFTIAHWYTPNGTLIEGSGITPAHEVANVPDSEQDLQMELAIELLKQQNPTAGELRP